MAASTMRRLPRQVLDAVNRLLEEGRTIDEVTAFLQEMGAEVSRSSVGRYRKQWAEAVRVFAHGGGRAAQTAREPHGPPEHGAFGGRAV